MDIKNSDLVSLFEKSLLNIDSLDNKLEEIGVVIQIGDAICRVHGLTYAQYGELIRFEHGNKGIIFDLQEDYVSIFLLDSSRPVTELEVAYRTGSVFKVPVGPELLDVLLALRESRLMVLVIFSVLKSELLKEIFQE